MADKLDNLKVELNNAESVEDILNVLSKYYDLKNCKPSKITKAMLLVGLDKVVKMVSAKLK